MNVRQCLEQAKGDRDAALALVIANNRPWASRCYELIAKLKSGWRGTGEDIRLRCEKRGYHPKTDKAWGGMIHGALRKGLLKGTGERVPMKVPRSHARTTEVLERT